MEVLITKGMPDKGAKVVVRGGSDDLPGAETGDVVFHIRVQPHPVFKRLHQHLLMEKDIPLVGALTGIAFTVKHLDGRTLHVKSSPGEVIQPNSFKCVPGGGMPLASNHYRHGDLLIRFTVIFPPPTAILRSPADIAAIEKLLPATMDAGVLAESRRKRRAEARKAEEEEEDEDGVAGGGSGAGGAGGGGDDGVVLTGAAARAARSAEAPSASPASKKPATSSSSSSSSGSGGAAKGGKGKGSGSGGAGAGGGEDEAEEGAPVDEDVTLAACVIEAKIGEAKSMQEEDSRCVEGKGALPLLLFSLAVPPVPPVTDCPLLTPPPLLSHSLSPPPPLVALARPTTRTRRAAAARAGSACSARSSERGGCRPCAPRVCAGGGGGGFSVCAGARGGFTKSFPAAPAHQLYFFLFVLRGCCCVYMRKTPLGLPLAVPLPRLGMGALRQAARLSASTSRVWLGSITPSSHRRALL